MKDIFNIEDFYEQLIIRFLNGNLSTGEVVKLERWLDESPENRELFRLYQKIWIGSAVTLPNENIKISPAWEKILVTIRKPTYRQIYNSRQRVRRIYLKFAKIAAIVTAIFALGVLTSYFVFYNYNRITRGTLSEIIVPKGSTARVVLPDSTTVWLNAGSTLSYTDDFNHSERIVKLKGEAYFDAYTDPGKPFIVSTPYLNVRAVGTQFNVKAYPDDDVVLTTLIEGIAIIEIQGEEKPFTYNLQPRQNFTLRKHNMALSRSDILDKTPKEEILPEKDVVRIPSPVKPISPISVANNIIPELYISWKDEIWVIEGETMAEMAIMLERKFNTKINIQSEELKSYRFTGKIMNETLEQVLDILKMTTPLKYSVEKGYVDWDIDHDLKNKYDKILVRK